MEDIKVWTPSEKELSLINFNEALRKGKVKFTYRKKDGSLREALGTLHKETMGEENYPSNGNTESKGPENQIRYYDLNSNGWRSFLSENLLGWDDIMWDEIIK